jgi:hypothetical protein
MADQTDPVLRPTTPDDEREVTCAVCGQPGILAEFDPVKGFRITHPGRLVACRVPPNPPGVVDGELAVPVEISDN